MLLSFTLVLIILIGLLAAGNMRHLIVEACIARNLLDTSAYLWPGYVNVRNNQIPRNPPNQMPGWSSLLKGASLTPSLVTTLVSIPASRYAALICTIFCYWHANIPLSRIAFYVAIVIACKS